MMLDAHCHIDQFPNPLAVAQECEAGGILVIAVTNLPSHYTAGLEHVRQFRQIKLALGFHPLVVAKHHAELTDFLRLLPQVSIIGEIGLDFSREGIASKAEQIAAFTTIAQALAGTSKFVTLHSRSAEESVLSILTEHKVENAVFHWYSGGLTILAKAVEQGYYFSVNPAMVRSDTGQRIITRIPRDRLLTETDGPYVKIGNRAVRPSDVAVVLDFLAVQWRMPVDEVTATVLENFHRILPPQTPSGGSAVQPSRRVNTHS